ncbi:SRA-YDG [Rhizopogon salebrosus TDB-379]|nr:SRA-YDG [Rhizopogon salebrosus TDB-379]
MSSRDGRTFGHISGVEVGATFASKAALLKAGVHENPQGGIHGSQELGAFSICLSKGYEDNDDNGNIISYVGSGGRDEHGDQSEHQSFENHFNKSLLVSYETKRPVRVVRGANVDNYYAPSKGYRYDGLYVVDEAKMQKGKGGYDMCTFTLRRIEEEGQKPIPTKRTLTHKKLANMMRKARST